MTEQSKAEPAPDESDASAASERIVSEGERVRERIRKLMVDTVHSRKLGLDELGRLGREVLDGAVAAVDRAVPAEKESALRQVFDGLQDAYATAANATRLAIDEAAARGEKLAREDVDRVVHDLGALERMFFDSVTDTIRRSGREIADQLETLLTHARRAGTSIRPSVEAALGAARREPFTLTREAAAASVEATRRTAGFLMQAMGGFLQAAGDLVAGAESRGGEGGQGEPPQEDAGEGGGADER